MAPKINQKEKSGHQVVVLGQESATSCPLAPPYWLLTSLTIKKNVCCISVTDFIVKETLIHLFFIICHFP